jgi:hypothetical protein
MDPNQALADILAQLRTMQYTDGDTWDDSARQLAESVEALDGWLTMGGFLPDRWKEAAKESHWQDVLSSTNSRAYDKGFEAGKAALMAEFREKL